MTKKIQFNNIKEITFINDNEILLKFDKEVIFDTTGTFTEGQRPNQQFQWPIKEIRLNDSQKKFTDELRDLVQNFQGKKIEFSFQESEIQLMLFPKSSPFPIFVIDENKINVYFFEDGRHLEIEFNDKSVAGVSWKAVQDTPNQKLASLKAAAKSELQAKINNSKLIDEEITNELKRDSAINPLIENSIPSNWQGYIDGATNESELNLRKQKLRGVLNLLKSEKQEKNYLWYSLESTTGKLLWFLGVPLLVGMILILFYKMLSSERKGRECSLEIN